MQIFQNIVFEWLTINDQTGKAKEIRETAMSGRSVSSQRHAHVQLYQKHGARFLTTRKNLLNGNVSTCCGG